MMENGIYGIHIESIYCEVRVNNEKIINGFIDYYGSNTELSEYVINAIDIKRLSIFKCCRNRKKN